MCATSGIAPWLQSVAQDIRYGLRTLRRHPGFTAVAVATLGLGIGANTAIFSVVNTVLLTPLPYEDSDRLVHIVQNAGAPMTSDGPAPRALAALDTVQLPSFRSQVRSLSHVAAFGITSATLTGQGDSVRLDGAEVSPDTFAMLGVRPVLGRPFDRRDELEGADPVVILGHGLWQRRFATDPDVIGRSVTIEGVDRSVLGVMPPRFAFPDAQTQFWVPFVLSAPESGRRRRVPVACARTGTASRGRPPRRRSTRSWPEWGPAACRRRHRRRVPGPVQRSRAARRLGLPPRGRAAPPEPPPGSGWWASRTG